LVTDFLLDFERFFVFGFTDSGYIPYQSCAFICHLCLTSLGSAGVSPMFWRGVPFSPSSLSSCRLCGAVGRATSIQGNLPLLSPLPREPPLILLTGTEPPPWVSFLVEDAGDVGWQLYLCHFCHSLPNVA
jgi:hypothetical protein